MTIPEPANLEPKTHLDIIVGAPPDPIDDTDRTREPDCDCGHAKVDHEPLKQPDNGQSTWQCLYCACTRAYPQTPVPSH